MEGKGDELETIDVSELMQGLDDDANSPRAKQVPTAPLSKQKTRSTMASANNLPLDSFVLEPSDVAEVPQWLSSFNAQKGIGRPVASPSGSLIGNSPVFGSTTRSKGGSSMGGSSSHTADLFGDKLSISQHITLAANLERSLSFEASPQNERKSAIGQKDVVGARQGQGSKLVDSVSWRLNDSEGATSPLNASLPGALSLKRWLQYDNHLSKGGPELKSAAKASGNEAQPKLPPQQGSPPVVHPTSKVSGPSTKAPLGYSNMHGYANQDGGSAHARHTTNRDAGYPMPSSSAAGQNRIGNPPQAGGRRRQRHSFTGGNRDPQFVEDRNAPVVNNRPSSWELEKVMVDPKLKVVLYSTSAQTDVHAYEDSNAVRAILMSLLGSSFDEKSISQHPEFEQELKNALNTPTLLVPTVCVRGRYIAGVDNIMQLYKKGVLGSLVQETLAHGLKPNAPCICRGGKFLICPVCKGKRKLARQGEDAALCRHCSGTGLIKCPSCLNS